MRRDVVGNSKRYILAVSGSFLLFCCALFLLNTTKVEAAVIEADDSVFGVGSLTHDQEQDLFFLDVNLSLGRSYMEMISSFGVGGEFEGYRYATGDEVDTLVNNFGIVGGVNDGDSNVFFGNGMPELMDEFIDFVGGSISHDDPLTPLLIARTGDYHYQNRPGFQGKERRQVWARSPHVLFDLDLAGVELTGTVPWDYAYEGTSTTGAYGSWLVRDENAVVPEPATVALLGIGVVCLAATEIRRRRKKKAIRAS